MLASGEFQTKFAIQMCLEQERERYIESLHDEMENDWQMLVENIDSEDFHQAFLEMKRAWDERMREFEMDFFASYLHEKTSKLKRRLRREKREKEQLKALLEERNLELYQAKGDLKIERGLTEHLREASRCKECNGRL